LAIILWGECIFKLKIAPAKRAILVSLLEKSAKTLKEKAASLIFPNRTCGRLYSLKQKFIRPSRSRQNAMMEYASFTVK